MNAHVLIEYARTVKGDYIGIGHRSTGGRGSGEEHRSNKRHDHKWLHIWHPLFTKARRRCTSGKSRFHTWSHMKTRTG